MRVDAREVPLNDRRRRPLRDDAAVLEEHAFRTEALHRVDVVAHEEHRPAAARDVAHAAQALLLKGRVADGEHLVDEQDVGLEVRGHRECQLHVHAARIALDRRIDEAVDFGELDDLLEAAFDLRPAHAEDCAAQKNIFAAGELGVKAGADFEQRSDPAANLDTTLGRVGNPRQNLEQRALARSVPSDDAQHGAFRHREGHVAESPDSVVLRLAAGNRVPDAARPGRCARDNGVTQRAMSKLSRADGIALAQPLDANRRPAARLRPHRRTSVPCGGSSTRRRTTSRLRRPWIPRSSRPAACWFRRAPSEIPPRRPTWD